MAINGTLELIDSVTVGSGGAASIQFTSIPQTYSDLILKVSCRGDVTATTFTSLRLLPNGSSSNGSTRWIRGNGAAASSDTDATGIYSGESNTNGATANTFSSFEWYIPNYAGSTYKSFSIDSVHEQNGTTAYQHLVAGLWSNTAAITSITLNLGAGSFVEHSTAYLYGVTRVPAGAKATGGVIYSDSNYWYHTFTSSGVFTPSQSLSCDVLVVAGGGGGGYQQAGGGGAGGLRSFLSQSVTASTNYTVAVGSGGVGSTAYAVKGASGSNSSISGSGFTTITSTGGGGGGTDDNRNGVAGGSGGGAATQASSNGTGGAGNAGSYSPVEGFAGGNGVTDGTTYRSPGGGGGAGGAGANGTAGVGNSGVGGIGATSALINAVGIATGIGQLSSGNFYLAGGGGGQLVAGGLGGGGAGRSSTVSVAQASGVVNSGSGGGGGASTQFNGGNGGSGLVVIRYAK